MVFRLKSKITKTDMPKTRKNRLIKMMYADFGFPSPLTIKPKYGPICKNGKYKYEDNCNEFVEDDPNVYTSGADNCYNCKNR